MTSAMHQIPSGSTLTQLALDTARRCGVDVDAAAGDSGELPLAQGVDFTV